MEKKTLGDFNPLTKSSFQVAIQIEMQNPHPSQDTGSHLGLALETMDPCLTINHYVPVGFCLEVLHRIPIWCLNFHDPKHVPIETSWWFQPPWKIWVKLDQFPQVGVKIKISWKHHLGNHWILRIFSVRICDTSATYGSKDAPRGWIVGIGDVLDLCLLRSC